MSMMPASKEAIQAAVDSYRASLHDPPEARRSMREIAADFDVLPQTLSQRVNKGYSDHNTAPFVSRRSHLKKKVV